MRLSPIYAPKKFIRVTVSGLKKCRVIGGNAISGISFPEVCPASRVLRSGESVIRVISHNRPLPDKYITLVRLAIKITFLRSLSEAALLSLSARRISRLLKIFIAAAPCRSESLTRSTWIRRFFSPLFSTVAYYIPEKAPQVS